MSSDFDPSEFVTIPEGWTCKRLIDCTIDGNLSYGIVQPGQHVSNGIPVIRINNINNGQLDLQDVLKVDPEIEKKYQRTRLEGGEVLLTLVGSTGQSFVAPPELKGWNVPRAIAVIRADQEIGSDWINICLQSKETKHFLDVRANTTVQKTLNLKDVRDIPILLPPKEVKELIEGIATSIAKKIELNRQTNQTLELIVQTLFKSWFVDFEPTRAKIAAKEAGASPEEIERAAMCAISGKTPDQLAQLPPETQQNLKTTAALFPDALLDSELVELPEGWHVSEIGKEVDVVGGGTPSTANTEFWEDGEHHWTTPKDMSNLTDKILLETDRKITDAGLKKISSGLLPRNTVLMSSRAPVGYLAIAKIPVAINQGYIAMKCDKILSPEYVVQWAESVMDEIKQRSSGTTFAEISKTNFRLIRTLVPNEKLVQAYTKEASSVYEKITSLLLENRELISIRDSLLPKLLSGSLAIGIDNE